MKVFKHSDNMIRCIAGEMLNREANCRFWFNGRRSQPSVDFPEDEYRNYPKYITHGCVQNTIKYPSGCVVFSGDVVPSLLIEEITNTLLDMEREMNAYNVGLPTYHTIAGGVHTNLKVKPSMRNTKIYKGEGNYNNKKRVISEYDIGMQQNRYIWTVGSIRTAHMNINTIFADYGNIFNYDDYDDRELIFDYNIKYIKGYKNIINTKSIKISQDINNMALAFGNRDLKCVKREKITSPIYNIPYSELIIESHDPSTCNDCNEILFDDNYAVASKDHVERGVCRLICPFCMHYKKRNEKYICGYKMSQIMCIFRVKVPFSLKDLIDEQDVSPEHKEMYYALYNNKLRFTNDRNVAFVGDEYAAVSCYYDMMYDGLPQVLVDKKIIIAEFINIE